MTNIEAFQNGDKLPDSYWTVAGDAASELKVQRSRFLGRVGPAADQIAARAFIKAQETAFHDARHVCYAWRLGYGQDITEIRSDAGEPAGSAGEPLLAALRKADISDAVVVVVRYFGGVKLGTGGLARAYGQAAETALAASPRREILLGRDFELSFPYTLQKTLDRLLAAHGGRIIREDYTEAVSWGIWLPHSTWETFARALTEATSGRVELQSSTP